ncbi:MAG: diacylglycerol kinase family lipid kinase [Chloroflexi bacterium]|nr:diacylglycerol kinase family lipid kinase [Chloroflexota bacterium]
MGQKLKLIVNPAAGRGDVGKRMPIMRELLTSHGLDFTEEWSRTPGEAISLARQAAEDGYPIVVAVGGDGTVQEVANGLLTADKDSVVMGILPIGSGSDFAYSVGILPDMAQACRILRDGAIQAIDGDHIVEEGFSTGVIRAVDVGQIVGERYFTNGVGIGFDAQVAIESRKITQLRGFLIYLLAVFRTLRDYELPKVTLDLDGKKWEQTITLATVANGRRHGGGFLITPGAKVNDGLFEICIGRGLNRLGILQLLPQVIKGTHIDKEPVTMARARRVVIESEDPLPVHADGEIVATAAHRLEMELQAGRLQVIVGPEGSGL